MYTVCLPPRKRFLPPPSLPLSTPSARWWWCGGVGWCFCRVSSSSSSDFSTSQNNNNTMHVRFHSCLGAPVGGDKNSTQKGGGLGKKRRLGGLIDISRESTFIRENRSVKSEKKGDLYISLSLLWPNFPSHCPVSESVRSFSQSCDRAVNLDFSGWTMISQFLLVDHWWRWVFRIIRQKQVEKYGLETGFKTQIAKVRVWTSSMNVEHERRAWAFSNIRYCEFQIKIVQNKRCSTFTIYVQVFYNRPLLTPFTWYTVASPALHCCLKDLPLTDAAITSCPNSLLSSPLPRQKTDHTSAWNPPN